ncbi:hypothetical protein D3870_20535 [Noviherbaspirillum cavernae]|uniref:DUF6351 domain-containing protein n=2 Tax=Noviherbaspirillum cavernae TaxID=2320862 RepID=A0A418WVR3_9BURK|nr:hypothetical protein D3870_20535 [Noviherbaspirillum cavernae]
MAAVAALMIAGLAACSGDGSASVEAPQIKTSSSRPDIVSGGDTLVEVTVPQGFTNDQIRVFAGTVDVTTSFKPASRAGVLLGRVGGLPDGATTIEARLLGATGAVMSRGTLTVVNHPVTGPVFAGAKQEPFVCTVATNNLGQPLDRNCSAATEVSYQYWSTNQAFKPYDPQAPAPADLAKTTTSEGKAVNFIVRLERGTINRGIYQIAFLHQPGTPLPDPWTTTDGWNRRLRYNFGGGCGGGYTQGAFETVAAGVTYRLATAMDQPALARGYAVATSSLNVAANNCNTVLAAETLSMTKEYFIKKFGVPAWTVGKGGSGGSVQQFDVAQSYPGLLDGLSTDSSFPTMMEAATIFSDCKLIRNYMTVGATMPWTDEQKRAVTGYASWQTCNGLAVGLGDVMVNASSSCSPLLPVGTAFHPVTNPGGVRCALSDNFVNVLGRDPATQIARRPLDNVGVQYGLQALKSGAISVDQFLELNEKVGGFDANGQVQVARHVGDSEALRIAYQTGRVLVGTNLDAMPIIASRAYNDTLGDLHDRTRDFQIRAKLDDLFGNHDNHVLLIAPSAATPGAAAIMASMLSVQIVEMEKWLDAIAADTTKDSLAQKVKRNKPQTAKDACWRPDGSKVEEPASFDSTGTCNTLYKPFLDPRSAAGAPLAETALKCQLKPVDVNAYGVPFTVPQTARLNAIFAEGVCDYAKPGVQQQAPSRFWASF